MQKNVEDLLNEYKALIENGEFNNLLKSKEITLENVIQRFGDLGVDEATTKAMMAKAIKEHQFKQIQDYKKQEFKMQIALGLTLAIVIAGPIFGISSILWYALVTIIAATLGYFGFSHKPIAGISGEITFALLFPITYSYYFLNRISYLKIELAVPIILALIPAGLIFYLISYFIYNDSEI